MKRHRATEAASVIVFFTGALIGLSIVITFLAMVG